MVLSNSLEDFAELFKAVYIVASSETEGLSLRTNKNTPCEESKQWLKVRFSTGEVNSLFTLNFMIDILEVDDHEDEEEIYSGISPNNSDTLENGTSSETPTIKQWLIDLSKDCMKLLAIDDGDHDNLHYLPQIIKPLMDLCSKFPFWTAVMVPVFGKGNVTASSATVESYFNELKNRLVAPLPKRVDDFIISHLRCIEGAMKITAASTLIQHCEGQFESSRVECCSEKENNLTEEGNSTTGEQICLNKESNVFTPEVSNEIKTPQSCNACKLTGKPSGAHKCFNCKRSVHAIEGCSLPIGEEGYGQQRVCMSCNQTSNINNSFNDVSTSHTTNASNTCISQLLIVQQDNFIPEIHKANETPLLCIACKHTGKPSGAHKCINCKRAVHALEGCSLPSGEEGYGQQRICISCSKTANMHNPVTKCSTSRTSDAINTRISQEISYQQDMSHLENWRGQAIPPKKRSRYLTPCPEWLLIQDENLKKKCKIGLLRNGGSMQLKAIKVGKCSVSLANTCSFDALIQILASSYCDSKTYRESIDVLPKSDKSVFQLVSLLVIKGVNRYTYKVRAELLYTAFTHSEMPSRLIIINCESIVTKTVQTYLQVSPSLTETTFCSSEFCSRQEDVKAYPLLRVNSDILMVKGIEFLQEAVENGQCLYADNPCHCTFGKKQESSTLSFCEGLRKRNISPGIHLFIDIPGRTDIPGNTDVEQPLMCTLDKLPLTLTFLEKTYYLRGCVGFNSPVSKHGVGHYIAYSHRLDGSWEMYDDLSDKETNVHSNMEIFAQLILYSV